MKAPGAIVALALVVGCGSGAAHLSSSALDAGGQSAPVVDAGLDAADGAQADEGGLDASADAREALDAQGAGDANPSVCDGASCMGGTVLLFDGLSDAKSDGVPPTLYGFVI
jgi:hypothetical protein